MQQPMLALWQRQQWENEQQHTAFQYYRDMPKPRSVDGAYRLYFAAKHGLQAGDESVAKKRAVGGWQNWSRGRDWNGKPIPDALSWEERAAAYDAELDRQLEAQLAKDLIVERRQLIRDEMADYKEQLAKWREVRARTQLHEQQRSTRKKKGDEQATAEVEIIFVDLNIRDWFLLSQWRKVISEQGRRVLGMPERISENKIHDWRSQAIADIRAGVVTYQALAEAFDEDLATELFRLAGVLVGDGS